MLTLKDVLTGKVMLDIECVDRVYLNGYVKYLQLPGGLITFIREQLGFPIPSPIVLPPVTDRFRKAVEVFAQAQGLSIVDFARGEEKDDTARPFGAVYWDQWCSVDWQSPRDRPSLWRGAERSRYQGLV